MPLRQLSCFPPRATSSNTSGGGAVVLVDVYLLVAAWSAWLFLRSRASVLWEFGVSLSTACSVPSRPLAQQDFCAAHVFYHRQNFVISSLYQPYYLFADPVTVSLSHSSLQSPGARGGLEPEGFNSA